MAAATFTATPYQKPAPLFGLTAPKLQNQLDLSGVAKMPVNAGMTAQSALLSRLDPSLAQARTTAETNLTNQGLRPGTEAYNNAANLIGQQENDARIQAGLQGLNVDMAANNQGFNQALQSGEFGNNAQLGEFNANLAGQNLQNQTQQQDYNQWLGGQQLGLQGAEFNLGSQNQDFNQGLSRDQFGLQQQNQTYNQGLQDRQFGLNQQNQQYNQGLQDRQFGLESQGQNFNQGLANAQFDYQKTNDQRNIDAAQHNSTMNGLFGLGTSVGVPLLQKALGGLGKTAAQTAAGAAGSIGTAAGTAGTAGAPATGLTGALGLGGGSGLFGLGAATIPVVGGAIAGIGLLAKKFFGNGGDRQAANQLTGAGGVHDFFKEATAQIQQLPAGPERQQAEDARDRQVEQQLVAFSKKSKDAYYQAKQTLQQMAGFSTVRPLLG